MATGAGWKRFGPMMLEGEARRPHTGSVRTRSPSTSSSTVEWPSHVARNPLSACFCQRSRGSSDGSGACGTRRFSPPKTNSTAVESIAPFLAIGPTGRVLTKTPSR